MLVAGAIGVRALVPGAPLLRSALSTRPSQKGVAASRRLSAVASMEPTTFGDNLPAWEAGSVKSPAVIVLQEWWGVNDVIKGHALKIADAGYRVMVPDLYKGKIGVDKEEAAHLMNNLDFQAAVEELKAAVKHLKDGGAERVGITGFCMGGALSLAAAQHAGVACAAPFYGLPNPAIAQPEGIKVPVQMHTGALDEYKGFSDPDSFRDWGAKVNAAGGGPAEIFIYEACGHGFLNTGEEGIAKRQHMGFPEPPQAQQEAAWERLLAFLDANLRK